jgi:asparagine N-glycosylation enzyme membrane subunit Stt3
MTQNKNASSQRFLWTEIRLPFLGALCFSFVTGFFARSVLAAFRNHDWMGMAFLIAFSYASYFIATIERDIIGEKFQKYDQTSETELHTNIMPYVLIAMIASAIISFSILGLIVNIVIYNYTASILSEGLWATEYAIITLIALILIIWSSGEVRASTKSIV